MLPEPSKSAHPTEPARAIRTLVVDDNELVRKTVQLRLTKLGYQVMTADSGESAFALANEHPFDLVVTDVSMGRVSGVHLTRMLRSSPRTESLSIVLLTAEDDPRGRFWGRNAGADAYVSKADMHTELLPAIARVIENRDSTAESEPAPSGALLDPLDEMTEVLDDQLFAAVVMSEAQHLIGSIGDAQALCEAANDLLGDVLSVAYVHLKLHGKSEPSCSFVARAPFPMPAPMANLAALELPVSFEPRATRIIEDPRYADQPIQPGERRSFPITVGDEELGEIVLYGGSRPISRRDANTAEVLSTSMAPVLKSMRLLRDTQRMATTDALTGLTNRRRAVERIETEIKRVERHSSPLAVIILDIDHFKSVNDTYGHNAGDDVLRTLAGVLGGSVRSIDIVARWGGEEFLVVLPEAPLEAAKRVGERIRASIEAMPPFQDGPPKVTASLGLSMWQPGDNVDTLVDRADGALYEAKHGGRNRLVVAGA